MLRNALIDINSVYQKATASKSYHDYFGDYDTYRGAKVKDSFEAIDAEMRSGLVTFRSLTRGSPDFEIKSGVVAWVQKSDNPHRINFQPPWWSRSPELQAETIVHEMSHLAAGTDDRGYTQSVIIDWAQRVPMDAVKNAESYGMYAYDLYP
jgi:hypothetical protein